MRYKLKYLTIIYLYLHSELYELFTTVEFWSGCLGDPWLSKEGAGLRVTEFCAGGKSIAGDIVQVGVNGKCGVIGEDGTLPCMSIWSTLWRTSPQPGLLSFKSDFVSRHKALPIKKKSIT